MQLIIFSCTESQAFIMSRKLIPIMFQWKNFDDWSSGRHSSWNEKKRRRVPPVSDIVGREEIDEVEEDSTEIGRQTVHCSRPEKISVDRPVDRRRDRSNGQSTSVNNVHRCISVDHPVDRGMARSTDWKQATLSWVRSTVDMGRSTGRSTDRRVLAFLSRFGFLFGLGSNLIGVS